MAIKEVFLPKLPEKGSSLFWISVSKIKVFDSCKAKYYYQYIEKLAKKPQPFQYFGKFLHEVLEFFQKEIIKGNTNLDNIILKECFHKSLEGGYKDKITIEQKNEAYLILLDYLKLRAELRKLNKLPKLLQVEKPFNLLINDEIFLNGFIDFVNEDSDKLINVVDYKTNKDKKYLAKDFLQLEVYSYILFLEQLELEKVRGTYSMLKFGFDEIPKEFSRESQIGKGEYFVEKVNQMRDEKFFRANPSGLCSFCDWLDQCNTGQDFVKMLEAKKRKKERNSLPVYGEGKW